MNLFTHIVLLIFLNVISGHICVVDQPLAIKWEAQLRKDLQCDYNVKIPPKPAGSETLTVNIHFKLRYFSLDTNEGILVAHVWIHLDWNDERLKWDPEKYGGVTKTELFSGHIWSPIVKLFNGLYPDFDRFSYEQCVIESNGHVSCTKRDLCETTCNITLADFPYDAQECSLEFGAWGENTTYYKMNFSSRAMSMLGADYGSQWFISDYKQRSEHIKQLIMTLVFEREAESLAAVVLYPSLIISCLTVACLFLDVRSNVRLFLACFSIFNHYYWLIELGEYMPIGSADTPRLLFYYRGSMIISVFVLLSTFLLNLMCKKDSSPPTIIVLVNSFVQGSYLRFLVLPQWSGNDEVKGENGFNTNWINLANIINSLCLKVSIMAYIVMYFTLIPKPIPISY